ncbi:precorrin-6y C5,15-methyltransferase (decarboxylating) subunit CbiE [Gordonia rubripertincta]|uniref:precorrin-6y C5,15-methyltransferase (decarboxylating) subunit CbiE n=1 Tax=Gordonia rubripertincta TaxID=36822 RepID=UPI00117C7DE8|nr:precorrin-6y C5,15-methyltransferase (decarboxylating) subunit CbiE [Gordonia rubripertincta]TSD99058.1 precorrin-6y C5,15-methyltransferase (decarboxylating) subunit CbiE [Gordonia rubripertincta]
MSAEPRFVVVGIGADGWRGLGDAARDELRGARVIYGATRQLALLDDAADELTGTRQAWRSPMSAHLADVLENASGQAHILASGDPMFHGVGASIVARVGAEHVRVYPAVSSASLACARLGWDLATTRIVSAVVADPEVALTEATAGGRLLVLSRNETTPAAVAELLSQNGFGDSTMTVLEQLGGPDERIRSSSAGAWVHSPVDPLNIVAVDCVGPRRSRMPGRDDDTYDHDGQITKSTVRAVTVAALEPTGAQLLWDIGSGSGSVAIEWLRADDRGRAIAFEQNTERAERLTANAHRHGVGHRLSLRGAAPEALSDAPPPDAVFIGGGLDEKVLAAAWNALRPSGRIVVNAVTVENQEILVRRHAEHGGTLRRLSVETVAPLGTMTTWRPALPIVQWAGTRHDPAPDEESEA